MSGPTIDLNDMTLRARYDAHVAVAQSHRSKPARWARDYTAALRAAGVAVPEGELARLSSELASMKAALEAALKQLATQKDQQAQIDQLRALLAAQPQKPTA